MSIDRNTSKNTRIRSGPVETRPGGGRSGFSLIELVVAIGILVIMMSLAGQVFTLSVKSTGQATALVNLNQSLRLLEDSLREDLAGIDPRGSMLVIWSQPVNAYWTPDIAEVDPADGDPLAGYIHDADPEREEERPAASGIFEMQQPRADRLMLFTSRRTQSVIYPQIWSDQAQVVYGHAELGELAPDGTWASVPVAFPDPPDTTTYFPIPAQQWHLARRSVLLVDAPVASIYPTLGLAVPVPPQSAIPTWDPVTGLALADELLVRDGEQDIIAKFDVQGLASGTIPANSGDLERWMQRSQLDLSPPATMAERLGHYFLPNCASFKVEWALSDPNIVGNTEIVWVDPGDVSKVVAQLGQPPFELLPTDPPRNLFEAGLGLQFDPTDLGPGSPPDLSTRTTHAFLSNDPLFPKALRITVDVYDNLSRLARPIRHVMIIPVGPQS
jgi:prepilin-type N-terminal cleavage/methylation domain-containing protein